MTTEDKVYWWAAVVAGFLFSDMGNNFKTVLVTIPNGVKAVRVSLLTTRIRKYDKDYTLLVADLIVEVIYTLTTLFFWIGVGATYLSVSSDARHHRYELLFTLGVNSIVRAFQIFLQVQKVKYPTLVVHEAREALLKLESSK